MKSFPRVIKAMKNDVLKAAARKLCDVTECGGVQLHISNDRQRWKPAEQRGRCIDPHRPVGSRIQDHDRYGLDPDQFLKTLPRIGDIELVFGNEDVPDMRQLVRREVDGDAHGEAVVTQTISRLKVTKARLLL